MKITFSPRVRGRFVSAYQGVKRDINQTFTFYKENAQYGLERGSKLAKIQGRGKVASLAIKSLSTAAHTRVRRKDVFPFIGFGLFAFTNPIVGMGLLGFALGKSVNKVFAKFYRGIEKSANACMPKNHLHSGLYNLFKNKS